MTDYTISSKLSNETVYAYYRGRFWRWDGSIWKESHLMTQKFERARAADKKLTPPEFLSNGAEFAPLDEYEIDSAMLDALENAKPCKNAPIEPVKEDPTCKTAPNADAAAITAERAAPNATAETPTTSESAADASASAPAVSPQSCESGPAANAESSPAVRPAPSMTATEAAIFDYTQFDEQTAQTLQNYAFRALQAARTYYRDLMEIVVGAHNLLCGPLVPDGDNSRFGNRGEDTFRAWCASVHINKTKAYQLLQIQSFMDTCTPEEQSTLALLPFTAMRELVTGDTPEQVITMAKEGKVGTSKEVLELKAQLKAEKERADAAEAQRDAAQADVAGLTEQNGQLKERADAAEAREEEAWKMQSKAEARAKNAEDALKHQPIVGVTDPEEVQRQADALAAEAKAQASKQIEDAQRRVREAEAKYQKLQQAADGFLAPEQACAQQAKIIADSMRSMYLGWFGLANGTGTPLARMAAPIYQVCDEIRESLEEDTTINPTAAGSEEDAEREALFE